MKWFPWLIAGAALGIAVYILVNEPAPHYASTGDAVEDAANETSVWGSKQRVSGTGTGLVGKVKEGVGNLTGDDELAGQGLVDQAAGAIKDTAGQAAHAVADTLHEFNK